MSTAVAELRGVSKTYQGAVPVEALAVTSLQVRTGELLGVVGPSGSGKSTLLNLLGLLDRPTAGQVLIGGEDTHEMSDDDLAQHRAKHIGYVFQAFHLLDRRSAVDNVKLGLIYGPTPPRKRAAISRDALARVGLTHRLDSAARLLSGGERQRLAIARAVASEPSFLLCDEPTGNLDSKNAETVLSLLGTLARDGATVVVVTHASDVAARCSRVVTVKDGVVTEERP